MTCIGMININSSTIERHVMSRNLPNGRYTSCFQSIYTLQKHVRNVRGRWTIPPNRIPSVIRKPNPGNFGKDKGQNMGAFSGSMSFTQFYIDQPLADDWKVKYQSAIHHYRLKPLSAESEVERAVGWCHAQFPLDTELDTADYLFTNYLVLGMRIDTWQVPASMVAGN